MSRFTKILHNRFVLSLLTASIVALFIKLSIWQWHRYQYKKSLAQSFVTQLHAAPQNLLQVQSLSALRSTADGMQRPQYIKILATGHYTAQQFLLDNRTKNNQIGFDVITPFQLNNGQTILVDRGFVPADIHRHLYTDITPPNTSVQLTGLLSTPSKSFVLGPVVETVDQNHWPRLVMRIDPTLLSIALKTPLLPYLILLDQHAAHGFLRTWSPPQLWAAQSLGYCFQWLAMALVVLIIYFIHSFITKK